MGKILKEIKETETESVAEILKNPATEPVSEPETPKVDTELDNKVDTEVEHEPVIKPKKTKQPAPKQSDADRLLELHKQKEQLKKDIKDFDNSRKAVMERGWKKGFSRRIEDPYRTRSAQQRNAGSGRNSPV